LEKLAKAGTSSKEHIPETAYTHKTIVNTGVF
jgi:hypothetical protein